MDPAVATEAILQRMSKTQEQPGIPGKFDGGYVIRKLRKRSGPTQSRQWLAAALRQESRLAFLVTWVVAILMVSWLGNCDLLAHRDDL